MFQPSLILSADNNKTRLLRLEVPVINLTNRSGYTSAISSHATRWHWLAGGGAVLYLIKTLVEMLHRHKRAEKVWIPQVVRNFPFFFYPPAELNMRFGFYWWFPPTGQKLKVNFPNIASRHFDWLLWVTRGSGHSPLGVTRANYSHWMLMLMSSSVCTHHTCLLAKFDK